MSTMSHGRCCLLCKFDRCVVVSVVSIMSMVLVVSVVSFVAIDDKYINKYNIAIKPNLVFDSC